METQDWVRVLFIGAAMLIVLPALTRIRGGFALRAVAIWLVIALAIGLLFSMFG